MRGTTAKRIKNRILDENIDNNEATEAQLKNMIKRTKREWSRNPAFKQQILTYLKANQ